MSSKRRRTAGGARFHAAGHTKRPIDKKIITIETSVGDTQVPIQMVSATFPCTVVGIRWEVSITNSSDDHNTFVWALVLVKEGTAVDTLGLSSGAAMYNPEQNVLTWGVHNSVQQATDIGFNWTGDTKTMRKLQGGDQIQFIAISGETGGHELVAVVQFFCKT